MNVIISQPRYLPVINYLQRIYWADAFVLLDDVQRQGRGVENRNKILCDGRARWLTIPIRSGSREKISATLTNGMAWVEEHKRVIARAYATHPFFSEELVHAAFADLNKGGEQYFATLTRAFLQNVCGIFRITPHFTMASDLAIDHEKTGPEHIVDIAVALGATLYISGKNGMAYGIEEAFSGIMPVVYNCYAAREYAQCGQGEFTPWLAFFDQLFNLGLEKTRELIVAPLDLAAKAN